MRLPSGPPEKFHIGHRSAGSLREIGPGLNNDNRVTDCAEDARPIFEGCRSGLLLLPFTKPGVAVCTPAQAGGGRSTRPVFPWSTIALKMGSLGEWDLHLSVKQASIWTRRFDSARPHHCPVRVTVAQQTLDLRVLVQIQAGQPF